MKKNRETAVLILLVLIILAMSIYTSNRHEKLLNKSTIILKSTVVKKVKNSGTLGPRIVLEYTYNNIAYKVKYFASYYKYDVGDTVLIKCSVKDPLVCEIYDSTQASQSNSPFER